VGDISEINDLINRMRDTDLSTRRHAIAHELRHAVAALDAAEARDVGVRELVFSHGFSFGGQDHSHAESPFGPWTLTAYSGRFGNWAYTDSSGDDSENDWPERDDCEAAAQADYTARILSALHPASPLGAVAMREKAAEMCFAPEAAHIAWDMAQGNFPKRSARHEFIAAMIRALPTTFTDAELLAAAAELPEVRALVELLKQARGKVHSLYHGWHRQTDAALAPFARKGGQ